MTEPDWKWKYENLCKFANDYEAQRDALRVEAAELRQTMFNLADQNAELKRRLGFPLQENPNDERDTLRAQLEATRLRVGELSDLVNKQAEDEGLWSVPAYGTQPIAEAHLQQELRRLHAVAESVVVALGAEDRGVE